MPGVEAADFKVQALPGSQSLLGQRGAFVNCLKSVTALLSLILETASRSRQCGYYYFLTDEKIDAQRDGFLSSFARLTRGNVLCNDSLYH